MLGPTIGSILLSPTSEIIRAELGGAYAGLHLLLYGLMLMAIILFLPKGLNDPVMRVLGRLGRLVHRPKHAEIVAASPRLHAPPPESVERGDPGR